MPSSRCKEKGMLTKKEAISFLDIPEKHLDNYFKSSKEIEGIKVKGRWCFSKNKLFKWVSSKNSNTVELSMTEYEECFQFAIKMAYSSKNKHGAGIRGQRSEVQMADDFIMGILAEKGTAKFLLEKFGTEVKLDMKVHPDHITPQDIISIYNGTSERKPKLNVAIKSSKMKNCFNIINPREYDDSDRKSDIYVFARVDLPSDHLFRILRDHSFFKKVRKYLADQEGFREINALESIPIWICGFSYHSEFDKVESIPGQVFGGPRYVKSVSEMHHTTDEWKDLISNL